jgi:hypothetical protein
LAPPNGYEKKLGINNVNTCSTAYQAGGYAGLATAVLLPGEGDGALAEEGGPAIEAEIAGFTSHGLAQAISREGVCVNERAMLDAVSTPVSVESRANGTTRFVGKDATVVLNGEGRVVSHGPTVGLGDESNHEKRISRDEDA